MSYISCNSRAFIASLTISCLVIIISCSITLAYSQENNFEYANVRKSDLLPEESYVRLNPTLSTEKIDLFQQVISNSLKQHTLPKLFWDKDDDLLNPFATQLSPKYPTIMANTTLHQLNVLYPDPSPGRDPGRVPASSSSRHEFTHYDTHRSALTRIALPPTLHSVSLPEIDSRKNSHALTLSSLLQQQPTFAGVEVKDVNTLRFYPNNKPYDSLSVPDLGANLASKQYVSKKATSSIKAPSNGGSALTITSSSGSSSPSLTSSSSATSLQLLKRKFKSSYLSRHSLPLSSVFTINNPDVYTTLKPTVSPYPPQEHHDLGVQGCGLCSTFDPWSSMSVFIQPLQTISIDAALSLGSNIIGELDASVHHHHHSSQETLGDGFLSTPWSAGNVYDFNTAWSTSHPQLQELQSSLQPFQFGNDLSWLENIFHQLKHIKQYSLPPIEIIEEAIALTHIHPDQFTYHDEFDSLGLENDNLLSSYSLISNHRRTSSDKTSSIPTQLLPQAREKAAKRVQDEQRATLLSEYAPVFSHVRLQDVINNTRSGFSSHNIQERPFIHQNGQILTPSLQRHDSLFDVSSQQVFRHVLHRDPIITRVLRHDIIYDIQHGIYDGFITQCNLQVSSAAQATREADYELQSNGDDNNYNENDENNTRKKNSTSYEAIFSILAQFGQIFGFPNSNLRRVAALCAEQQLSRELLSFIVEKSLLPESSYSVSTSPQAWFHPALYVENGYLETLLSLLQDTSYYNHHQQRVSQFSSLDDITADDDKLLLAYVKRQKQLQHQFDVYFGWYDATTVSLPYFNIDNIINATSTNTTTQQPQQQQQQQQQQPQYLTVENECPVPEFHVYPYVHNKPNSLNPEFIANVFSFSKSEQHRTQTGQIDMFRHGNELLQITSQVEFLCDRVSPKQTGTQTNLWVGGLFSTAHLHYDTLLNVYLHLHGTKRFMLLPPVNTNDVHLFPSLHSHIQQAQGEWTDLFYHYTTLSDFISGCIIETDLRSNMLQHIILQTMRQKTITDSNDDDVESRIPRDISISPQELYRYVKTNTQRHFNPQAQENVYNKLSQLATAAAASASSSSTPKSQSMRNAMRNLASQVQTTPETLPFGAFIQLGLTATRYIQNYEHQINQFIATLQFLFGLIQKHSLQVYIGNEQFVQNEIPFLLIPDTIPPLHDVLSNLQRIHLPSKSTTSPSGGAGAGAAATASTSATQDTNSTWQYTGFDSLLTLSTQCPMHRSYDTMFTFNEHADLARDLVDEQLHHVLGAFASFGPSASSPSSLFSSSDNENDDFVTDTEPNSKTPPSSPSPSLPFHTIQNQRYKNRDVNSIYRTRHNVSTNDNNQQQQQQHLASLNTIPVASHMSFSTSSSFTFHAFAKTAGSNENTGSSSNALQQPSIVDIVELVGIHALFSKSIEQSGYQTEQKQHQLNQNISVCIYHPTIPLISLLEHQKVLFTINQSNSTLDTIAYNLCGQHPNAIIIPKSTLSQIAAFFQSDLSTTQKQQQQKQQQNNLSKLIQVIPRAPFWLSFTSSQFHRANARLLATLQTFLSLPLPTNPILFQHTDYTTLFDWFWQNEYIPQQSQQRTSQQSQQAEMTVSKHLQFITQQYQKSNSPYLNTRLVEYFSSLRPMWVDLQPSDVLFLPPFYLHHVTALTPSISYNTWCLHADGQLQMVVKRSNMRLTDLAAPGFHKAINAALWLNQVNEDYTHGAGQLLGELLYSRYASHIQYLFNMNPFCPFSRISTMDGQLPTGATAPKSVSAMKNGDPMLDLDIVIDMMTQMNKSEMYQQQQKKNQQHHTDNLAQLKQRVQQRKKLQSQLGTEVFNMYHDENGYDYRSLYYHSPCELILSQPRVDEIGLYLIALTTQRLRNYDNVIQQRLQQFHLAQKHDPTLQLTPSFFDLFSEEHGVNSFNNRSTTLENIVHSFKFSPVPVNQLRSEPSAYISFQLSDTVMELATICNMGLGIFAHNAQLKKDWNTRQFHPTIGSTDPLSNRDKSQSFIQQLLQFGATTQEGGVGRVEKETMLFERFENVMTEELNDPITAQLFMLGCFSSQIYATHKAKGGIVVPEQ